jgi:hypothetical protein
MGINNDELNNLFDSIINKPKKPQPKKTEAFSKDNKDPFHFRRIKKVPYLKRWPQCNGCKTRLLGNRLGWFAEDKDGNHLWWCVSCSEKL